MANSEVTWELKILRDKDITVQKTVNQWKHEFKLKILVSTPLDNGITYMTLTRTKKATD